MLKNKRKKAWYGDIIKQKSIETMGRERNHVHVDMTR